MKLTIIIPTYNEQNTIEQLIQYVQAVTYPIEHEVIIVDDASVDRTFEKETLIRLKNKKESNNIRLFKNEINRGKGYSLRKGIHHAKGDIIVIQDADTEYDPREIPKLLEPILQGKTRVVFGSRFLGKGIPEGMAFPNYVANKVLTWITNMMYGLRLTDMETCYKVVSAELLKSLKLQANRFSFEPEIVALLAKRSVEIVELPIRYKGRTEEEGKKIKARDFFFAIGTLIKYKFL
jgi:glycosyltransferase involved in cell wall biosynthesis